jgi:tetratricopeptide (TPR) repeat protein
MSSEAKKIRNADTDAEAADSGIAGLWARHGNKVLIALTVALLIFWAVRYRQRTAIERQEATRGNLAGAWVALQQLTQFASMPRGPEIDKEAAALESQINQAVQLVLDEEKVDPTQAAWAWIARGDLYWAMAHRPGGPPTTAPSTQATTAPASQPAYDPIALAKNAYQQVVANFPSDPTALTLARYGLAAVAEEKGDLAAAREQYKALIETPNFTDGVPPAEGAAHVKMAEARLKKLGELEKPTLLLPATQPVARPSMFPGADLMQGIGPMLPSGPPSTAPATPSATTRP